MKGSYTNTIPIFFAVDDNYIPQLAVALRSLIDNSSENNFYDITVLIDNIGNENKQSILDFQKQNISISLVSVKDKMASIFASLHTRDYYTNTTYYRFFIPEMFPEYEKGLYLDCDIIITRDIADMFAYDIDDKLAGVITEEVISDIDVFGNYSEIVLGVPRNEYFNAGIMLMNLAAMREIRIEQRFIELLSQKTYTVAQDQDYLNVICYRKVRHFEKLWNKTPMPDSDVSVTPYIVHYKINFKPWRYDNIPYSELFWEYAKRTDYYGYFKNMKDNYSDAEKERDAQQYDKLEAQARLETEQELRSESVHSAVDSISLDFFDTAKG